jgi:hypothetical protein
MLPIKLKVSELLESATQHEPSITKDLFEIAEINNADLVGLENRFKREDSLFRKIHTCFSTQSLLFSQTAQILDDFARNINDVLRYTMIFEIENYTSDCLKTLQMFEEKNYQIGKIWNAWMTHKTRFDYGYRGINTTLISPQEQIFELQFHATESYTAKEANHFLYEKMRLPETG